MRWIEVVSRIGNSEFGTALAFAFAGFAGMDSSNELDHIVAARWQDFTIQPVCGPPCGKT